MTVLPRALAPMLAVPGALPPDDDRWSLEVKWDGVRVLVAVEDGHVALFSRNGNVVTGSYPELQALAAAVPEPVLLDGEVVALRDGSPDFGLLQERMHVRGPAPALVRRVPASLVLFDVLQVGAVPLLGESYDDRRSVLTALPLSGPSWQVPPAFPARLPGDAAALSEATRVQGMEGLVAKRRDSRYEPGRRSDCWVKVKHVRRLSAVVIGWKGGDDGRSPRLGSLVLALPTAGTLAYAGRVGTGLSAATLRALEQRLAPLARDSPPVVGVPLADARTVHWVEPVLVVDVDYADLTRERRLRHPSYKGLREDLTVADVEEQQ